MKKISAVLPSSLSEALARRAELHDRSVSAEIRQAVRAYLNSSERSAQNPDTEKEATQR